MKRKRRVPTTDQIRTAVGDNRSWTYTPSEFDAWLDSIEKQLREEIARDLEESLLPRINTMYIPRYDGMRDGIRYAAEFVRGEDDDA